MPTVPRLIVALIPTGLAATPWFPIDETTVIPWFVVRGKPKLLLALVRFTNPVVTPERKNSKPLLAPPILALMVSVPPLATPQSGPSVVLVPFCERINPPPPLAVTVAVPVVMLD